jgi:hypothetical protein
MQDFLSHEESRTPPRNLSGVNYFASQVVSLLVDRNSRGSVELREPLVQAMITASVSGSDHAFEQLLAEVRRTRISLSALADVYVPEAARRMGEAWEADRMSWLEVSIGVGRLQSLLREIGNAWFADQSGDIGYGTILLILPDKEQHTLGPMVAMGQMRRFGVSVCLRIGPSLDELRNLLETRNFDGIMISVGTEGKLPLASNIVKFLKSIRSPSTPILIGGAVMSMVEDVASCTGADYAFNDIGAALEAIGLKPDALRTLKRA